MTPADLAELLKIAAAAVLAEHDLDRAVKDAVRRSCVESAAPAAVRLQILQRITTVRVEGEI